MDRKNFKALTLTVAADIKSSPALYLYEIPTNMPLPVLLLPDTFSINKNTRVKKQNKQKKNMTGKHNVKASRSSPPGERSQSVQA